MSNKTDATFHDGSEHHDLCDGCGKPEGSFACKIRHLQINTGFAKAYEEM